MPDNMLHGLCVFLSRFRATPSYGATKPCLSSWLQPCISSWTSSRRLPTAHKPSVPTWSVPSWDDEPCCGATSRCDAVWSSRPSSLPCSTWWIPNGAPCSWPPRSVSTLSERSQRSSSSWRHRWTFSWRNSRDGNGDGGTQSPQEDEEEDEESTQAWAPQTRQGELVVFSVCRQPVELNIKLHFYLFLRSPPAAAVAAATQTESMQITQR